MADKYSKEVRSRMMSNIRGKWTVPEKKLHGHLKSRKIRHAMHPKMPGSPDAILKEIRLAIFVDGCFFHKCPNCYTEPASNREYWLPKIKANVERDKRDTKSLEESGWKVIRFWEHEIKKDIESCIERIQEHS